MSVDSARPAALSGPLGRIVRQRRRELVDAAQTHGVSHVRVFGSVLPDGLLAFEPGIPWRQIARMRDHLAHRHVDTSHAVLQGTVDHDLPGLEDATRRMMTRAADEAADGD